ncbi:GNAT family N-acetyltransferase [Polymorphobacter fuscus]|uniref:L-ornithine N(alpha)-acyltransferase n=1 Tax=Sandarakinorhabdus fusca TaxID=1439888 RepID=A0A7C9GSR5_9SPHN|nr:GNAT family N-acyltransferase [Polymorphobacter fuscus]KAB7645620.1 GNAT family N-acetyltransferase [Polymorphobacter fuscus]MQT18071.1 GNAT family N-acetyltransferase [Polymorphobacter fuscus]NJC08704.1 putative hemolysin [Polymorphobacter fuscus]
MGLAIGRATAIAPDLLAAAPFIHRVGQLDVRLAVSPAEIAAAQALRYQIFYEEMGAEPTAAMARARRDIDDYDAICDHLLVVDHGLANVSGARPHVVGTYRLLRQDVAAAHRGFYSAGEYDLSRLIAHSASGGQLLELGRSCVAPAWRNNATISLLWRGIAAYLQTHNIGHMFGCASLHGADPVLHTAELSYLYHHHLAPAELRATALPAHHVPMDRLPAASIDSRAAARALPPLIKGYLRVGAMVGDGGFIDHQFNTVDVFVIMPVDRITSRYATRFVGANDSV